MNIDLFVFPYIYKMSFGIAYFNFFSSAKFYVCVQKVDIFFEIKLFDDFNFSFKIILRNKNQTSAFH